MQKGNINGRPVSLRVPRYRTSGHMQGGLTHEATTNLPTTGNQKPGYQPFFSEHPCILDAIIINGGNVVPTSATQAGIRFWVHEILSTDEIGAIVLAPQSFTLAGLGTIVTTSNDTLFNLGSIQAWGAICVLSPELVIDPAKEYMLGIHVEPTFTAGNYIASTRPPQGRQSKTLDAGAQAYPYTPADNPATGILFSGNFIERMMITYRFRSP